MPDIVSKMLEIHLILIQLITQDFIGLNTNLCSLATSDHRKAYLSRILSRKQFILQKRNILKTENVFWSLGLAAVQNDTSTGHGWGLMNT
jgi:hypothetical protein